MLPSTASDFYTIVLATLSSWPEGNLWFVATELQCVSCVSAVVSW
jgi:hypothetical protein